MGWLSAETGGTQKLAFEGYERSRAAVFPKVSMFSS